MFIHIFNFPVFPRKSIFTMSMPHYCKHLQLRFGLQSDRLEKEKAERLGENFLILTFLQNEVTKEINFLN